MKQSKKLLGLGIVLAGVLSLGAISISSLNKQVNQQADASVGNYSTNASTYYNGITATSGKQLAAQLHDLITSTHQAYPTYDDSGKNLYQQKTDQYYENGVKVNGYIYDFYSGVKWPNAWASNAGDTTGGYNREHVWCQSLSNDGSTQLWGTSGGGSDMHHIRPTESRINSTRNNSPYGTISNRDSYKVYSKFGSNETYAHGGYKTGDVFEPLDSKKGDVARIILYVYLHYNSYTCSTLFGSYGKTNGSGSSSYFTSNFLSLTNITNKSTESAALEMLLNWNTSDPVDEIETRRNEQVAIYQGNRNPFIDNQTYADMIWGSGQPSTPTVTSVTVTPSSLQLNLSGTKTSTLSATVNGTNNPAQTVTWTSSNTSIATVSSSGVVTAKAVGTATITARSTVDTAKYGTCTVTIVDSTSPTTTVNDTLVYSTTRSSGTGYIDWSGRNNTYTGINSNAVYAGQSAGSYTSIQLRSDNSNSGIVTTSSGGKITKVTVTWNSNTASARVLGIYGKSSAYSSPTDLYGSNSGTQVGTIACASSTELTISGDYTYVGVKSQSGALYLDSITFTWESTQAATPTVSEVNVSQSALNLDLNGTKTSTLTATVSGTNTPAQTVTWTSSDTSVATVSNSGVVTAKAVGTATITATSTVDTTKSATCTVTVVDTTPTVDSVTVSPNSLNLDLNGTTTGTLTAIVGGTNTPAQTVTWTSSNTSIATVSNSGVVTAKAVGTATITATSTVDNTKSGTCEVTVVDTTPTVTSVTLSKNTLELNLSGTKTSTLTATVIGNYGPAQTVTWTSSNTSVATVSDGVVTAKAVGTATITATSTVDTTKSATCTVTVINVTNKGETPDNPYTVAEALALLQELGDQTSSTVYVRGYISGIEEISTSYGNATFNISDDGTTSNQLKVFRCKNVGNVKFTSEDEISVGDEVIITGVLKNYTSGNTTTPEFNSGCYIYSVIPPATSTGVHTFTKVTSVDDLKDGTYAIVNEEYNAAFDASLSTIDVVNAYQSISFSSDRFNLDAAYTVKIKAVTGGYSIRIGDGTYFDHTNKSTGIKTTATGTVNTISFSEDNAVITASDGYTLRFNHASDQMRFRYYGSATSVKPVQLYRMEDERFADLFLDSMTCNANGTSAPVFSTSWYELSLNYVFMSDTSKSYFTTGSANENGNLVEQAIARYEYIIGKYGTGTYDNFMERSGLSSNKMVAMIDKQNNIIIITACLSAFTLLSLAMVFVSRKKEGQ